MVFLNSSLYFVGLFLLDMCVFPFCFFLSLILTHLSTFLGYIQLVVISELIDTLDPKKGIREKVISFALSPLIDYCNEKASRLKTGFQINIQTSNGTHLMCKPKESSDYQELSAASSGEQLLATFLITDMLNALSGYGILMLDDLDKVDDSSLNNLLSLLCDREVSDSYDHIFLAGVNHNDTVKTIQNYQDIRMMDLKA